MRPKMLKAIIGVRVSIFGQAMSTLAARCGEEAGSGGAQAVDIGGQAMSSA
jgi:hypothetical protein